MKWAASLWDSLVLALGIFLFFFHGVAALLLSGSLERGEGSDSVVGIAAVDVLAGS